MCVCVFVCVCVCVCVCMRVCVREQYTDVPLGLADCSHSSTAGIISGLRDVSSSYKGPQSTQFQPISIHTHRTYVHTYVGIRYEQEVAIDPHICYNARKIC